jgi:hypothetical protein
MNNLRMVIGFVGTVLVLGLCGVVLLALNGMPIPDVLQNIVVGALTGLVGLLVPSRAS